MMFCSGAGAWSTDLILEADGSFSGVHHDSEMGDFGEDYPHGTVYLCTFRGQFDHITRINDFTYSLTLSQLELTTPYPVGQEWIEDQIRYISSEPYGLDGGTEFLFYTPEAPVSELQMSIGSDGKPTFYTPEAPVSELSQEFLSWFSGPYDASVLEENGTLSHYGLYNRAMDYGFFSWP